MGKTEKFSILSNFIFLQILSLDENFEKNKNCSEIDFFQLSPPITIFGALFDFSTFLKKIHFEKNIGKKIF